MLREDLSWNIFFPSSDIQIAAKLAVMRCHPLRMQAITFCPCDCYRHYSHYRSLLFFFAAFVFRQRTWRQV